jgi:hypothetical protein
LFAEEVHFTPRSIIEGPILPDRREGQLSESEASNDNPEELIEEAEARASVPTFQHSELLPEHEILQNKIPAVTEEANQGSDPEKKSRLNMGRSYTRSTIESIVVSC